MEPKDEPADTPKDEAVFYKKAAQYWSETPATIDGVLGGFGFVSRTDIQGSSSFLKQLFKMNCPPGRYSALDCGAGIGRVAKDLLIPIFERVDLVEQNAKFIEEAKRSIGSCKKHSNFFCAGLQDFSPSPETYDVIWCQWVLGHLTDEDFVRFFKACAVGLRHNGIIVVKENLSPTGKVDVDEIDSSVTRPLTLVLSLLERAGLRILKEQKQKNFPQGLYEVRMLALRPVVKETTSSVSEQDAS